MISNRFLINSMSLDRTLLRGCVIAALVALLLPSAVAAQTATPDRATQILEATAPAPEAMRQGATVLGYDDPGSLVTLREGTNELICVADAPGDDRFQAVCYHKSLEPYMSRGRELRAEGITGHDNIDIRHEEVAAGKLKMPEQPAVFYNMAGKRADFDLATASVSLFSVYIPYATAEGTGMPTRPAHPGGPWIMRPGTASAHIMIIPGSGDH